MNYPHQSGRFHAVVVVRRLKATEESVRLTEARVEKRGVVQSLTNLFEQWKFSKESQLIS
jgi:hypothetical protein